MNLGLNPAPQMTAVKIAAHTQRIDIVTCVAVLPIHDMRIYAGEVIVADIFTGSRLVLGMGRGGYGYGYEMERLGVPVAETRARFDESLEVFRALLTREEVAWDGTFYKFDPITVMPRPARPGGPRMLMATMCPQGIYHATGKGYTILTPPLTGDIDQFRAQVAAFRRAKEEMGEAGRDLILQASRAGFVTGSEALRWQKLQQAQEHYGRLDNMYTGPSLIEKGMVRSLPRSQSIEELAENILVCSAAEMVDRLGAFAGAGVDVASLVLNFGSSHEETLETIHRIAEDVMPHFRPRAAA